MKLTLATTGMGARRHRNGGGARFMRGAVEPNPRRLQDRFASAQPIVSLLKKAAAWKMAVRFEEVSFVPVINRKS